MRGPMMRLAGRITRFFDCNSFYSNDLTRLAAAGKTEKSIKAHHGGTKQCDGGWSIDADQNAADTASAQCAHLLKSRLPRKRWAEKSLGFER
jgi:hypothetical protein